MLKTTTFHNCVNNRCKNNIKCMALQFIDAYVHFERGIFKAFSKHQPTAPVFICTDCTGVNDVLQITV